MKNVPNIKNYELTFKVSGLSFLFTDMLIGGFEYFDPLFASDVSKDFYQYYRKEKVAKALESGLRWLSNPSYFKEYKKDFTKYYIENALILEQIIKSRDLQASSVRQFFEILSSIFLFDIKLDNKFTDKAYIHSKYNPILEKNLKSLGKFKNESRVWINQTFLEENNPLARLTKKLSKQFSVKQTDLENYKISELLELFRNKRVPVNQLNKRKISFITYFLNGKRFYITGTESASYIKKIQSNVNAQISEVKGLVANKTKNIIKGKVRVINVDYGDLKNMNKQISAMKNGEILVAEFTSPELMAACRKAKAIVTDLGGMLSHAAIISRELRITSIIGTKNASRIFKTGDLVEVDANKGIVRKI